MSFQKKLKLCWNETETKLERNWNETIKIVDKNQKRNLIF
jgi:hypothetical protein